MTHVSVFLPATSIAYVWLGLGNYKVPKMLKDRLLGTSMHPMTSKQRNKHFAARTHQSWIINTFFRLLGYIIASHNFHSCYCLREQLIFIQQEKITAVFSAFDVFWFFFFCTRFCKTFQRWTVYSLIVLQQHTFMLVIPSPWVKLCESFVVSYKIIMPPWLLNLKSSDAVSIHLNKTIRLSWKSQNSSLYTS